MVIDGEYIVKISTCIPFRFEKFFSQKVPLIKFEIELNYVKTNKYTKFQVNIPKDGRESLKNWSVKYRLSDGQTDGQTNGEETKRPRKGGKY